MIIYKLKEDWSSFKADEKFTASDYDGLYKLVNDDGKLVLAKIPTDLLDEVDNGVYWKPKAHERYYFIDDGGAIDSEAFYPDMIYDNDRLLVGNCFRIKKDARAMVAWIKARQSLIESGARFINSAGATIIGSKRFYTVYFTMNDSKLTVDDAYFSKDVVRDKVMCFDDREKALKSIEEHRDDWLTYLGG